MLGRRNRFTENAFGNKDEHDGETELYAGEDEIGPDGGESEDIGEDVESTDEEEDDAKEAEESGDPEEDDVHDDSGDGDFGLGKPNAVLKVEQAGDAGDEAAQTTTIGAAMEDIFVEGIAAERGRQPH